MTVVLPSGKREPEVTAVCDEDVIQVGVIDPLTISEAKTGNDTDAPLESVASAVMAVDGMLKSGGVVSCTSDEFYSAGCGRPRDYIITNFGPLVTFRPDNMVWDFADLSVREIQPVL